MGLDYVFDLGVLLVLLVAVGLVLSVAVLRFSHEFEDALVVLLEDRLQLDVQQRLDLILRLRPLVVALAFLARIDVMEVENVRNIVDRLVLLLLEQIIHQEKELLNQRHKQIILVEKVRKGVENLLGDELVPLLFEFRRQTELAGGIVGVLGVGGVDFLQLFDFGLELPAHGLRLEQVLLEDEAALSFVEKLLFDLGVREVGEVGQVGRVARLVCIAVHSLGLGLAVLFAFNIRQFSPRRSRTLLLLGWVHFFII